MSWFYTVTPFLIVFIIMFVDILCGDDTNMGPKDVLSPTHWPVLGQKRNNIELTRTNSNPPTWVRPVNINSKHITALLDRERFNSNQFNYPNRNNFMLNGNEPRPLQSNSGSRSSGGMQDSQRQSSSVLDNELREFSEVLLNNDVNNAGKYVTINYQGKTTSRSSIDQAPQPLLTIHQEATRGPTIQKLLDLHDNYILDSRVREQYTAQEEIEENSLLKAILETPVMEHTRNFLIDKGILGNNPNEFKDLLREIWFNMYARGQRRVGSSGFEHVFLGEIKNNQVSGLHNWLYFADQEKRIEADYLGYMKKIELGNKGALLKYHFKFHSIDKPVGSMFIGTSPEFEIALYTICFLLRPNEVCPLKLNGNRFIIRTYSYTYRGKQLIGSAFPEI